MVCYNGHHTLIWDFSCLKIPLPSECNSQCRVTLAIHIWTCSCTVWSIAQAMQKWPAFKWFKCMHEQKFHQFTLTTSFSPSVDEMCHFLPPWDQALVGAAVLVSNPTFIPLLLLTSCWSHCHQVSWLGFALLSLAMTQASSSAPLQLICWLLGKTHLSWASLQIHPGWPGESHRVADKG